MYHTPMVLAVTLLSLASFQPSGPTTPHPLTPAPPAPPAPSSPATPTATPAVQPPAAPPASATPAETRTEANPELILTMKDGTVFQGMLLRKDEKEYVLEIAGVPATFSAAKIDRVRVMRPVLERYKELRDLAAPTDIDQRISLIRWLADRKQLDLAATEADLLQLKNPKHVGVSRLVDDLRLQTDLLRNPSKGADSHTPVPASVPDDGRVPPTEFPFLTDAQVALIKVYELDLTTKPRVLFPREAAARMLEEFSSSPLIPASQEGKDAILRQDPLETVQLMFRLRARDYYDKVRVIDQPEPMRRFRDDVHRITLMNGCATSQCHGGRDAGRLVFSTFRPNTDTTLYTNYYILNNFRTGAGQPLIDWEKPEQSLLYQLALPRELSRYRHPAVVVEGKDVWKPPLTGPEDRRAKGMLEWIKMVYRPRPDYTLDYTPYRPFSAPLPAISPGRAVTPTQPVIR